VIVRAVAWTAGVTAAMSAEVLGTITETAATTVFEWSRIGAATPAASRCTAPAWAAPPRHLVSASCRRSSLESVMVRAVRLVARYKIWVFTHGWLRTVFCTGTTRLGSFDEPFQMPKPEPAVTVA
jgi:hypothetical protein